MIYDDENRAPDAAPAHSAGDVAAALAQITQLLAMVASKLNPAGNAAGGDERSVLATQGDGIVTPPAARPDPLTVGEAINEFLVAKAKKPVSDNTLRQYRTSLRRFARGRFHRPLQSLTVEELQLFADSFQAIKTAKTYCGDVRVFFRWCIAKRGYLKTDLTRAIELPDGEEEREPDPYTPAEAEKILRHLQETNLDLCRVMAIRFFAGLRSAEAGRGGEGSIKADYIVVSRAMSKTKRRRLVKIMPNLAAWLEATAGATWRTFSQGTITDAIFAAKVTPRPNGTRSGFISYHCALFEDTAKTAAQAGNTREVVETNYKALKTKEEAEAFFAILPAGGVVVKPKTNPGWFRKKA